MLDIPEAPERSCHDFCCSAFALFKADPIPVLPELTGPIHPLFRQKNFSPDFAYWALEPCLRLATRLLESANLVPYLNTLFNGEIRDIETGATFKSTSKIPNDVFHLLSIWPWPGQEEFNTITKRSARIILERMNNMLRFDVRTLDNMLACCTRTGDPLPSRLQSRFPRGCKSKITINSHCYDALVKLSEQARSLPPDSGVDLTQVVHIRFLIARALCHEIGHSLQNAAFGNLLRSREVFYKNHKLAEAGFELETQLFGGIFIDFGGDNGFTTSQTYAKACDVGKKRQQALAFHLMDWPSHHLKVFYSRHFKRELWSGRGFAKHDMLHTTPNSFVLSLFTDSFWRDSQKKYDPTSLHPPKIASWPYTHVDEAPGLLPMSFDEVEEFIGPRRARALCSSSLAPPEHRLEALTEDWVDCMSGVCLTWFDELKTCTLSKAQRKRTRRAEKRAQRALENVTVDGRA